MGAISLAFAEAAIPKTLVIEKLSAANPDRIRFAELLEVLVSVWIIFLPWGLWYSATVLMVPKYPTFYQGSVPAPLRSTTGQTRN
jgi:hypothetical protein